MPTLPQKASTSRRVEEFVEDKDYLFFASVSKSWRLAWTGSQRPKLTAAISEDRSVRQLSHCFRYGGLRRSALVCDAAAMLGRIDLFKHALFVGCPWHTETCFSAAGGGRLKTLRWVRANGCPWNSRTCSGATLEGHLHVLRWPRANGCPWTGITCGNAALRGH